MTEVELKAALTAAQAEALPAQLAALGFVRHDCLHEADTYWNAPDRDFRQTDEALRLRICRDSAATQTLLTYKGPKQDRRSSTRAEFETAVADGDVARHLLAALGYRALFSVDKARTPYVRGAVTACVDCVAGLGSFVELETLLPAADGREAAVDALLAILDSLGLPRTALTRQSYLELLITAATEKKSS